MKNFKKGFTLVELSVVVAIIAIIATVVLTALGDSKNKGNDAAVKSNLATIRGQTELFYSNNGNSFTPASGSDFNLSICPTPYNASGNNMFVSDQTIFNSIAEAKKRGNGVAYCSNSTINWAVAVGLKSGPNTSWCIDSGGVSKQSNFSPDLAINGTVCN